jgi:hypothetical protein
MRKGQTVFDFEVGELVEVISTSHPQLYGELGVIIDKQDGIHGGSLRLSFNSGEYITWMPVEDVS